ncbi:MAG: aldo/keto reductase family oxidoreductase [Turicibacter sp.]|uniref:Oxidoreductase n=1 Tax=Turicibacter faecis TaxID=2963365 RepID=A0ABN6ZHZ3_9FIRM|nr:MULTISPECIES: aldo/keto reductase [unclassified Turicibacter]MCI8702288.1 aldo/keto reductase family oxidoreductase [Turicibacter sp.]NCE77468.1 aldo/keto reductase family oxidoreductase [Turicibacter sp. TS3]BEH91410.1 oxidoreductase [Turicibacter sp. TC023]MCU7203801.1 aldo/keto reductase [Turicibacter sp. TA25]MCU7208683.1 aldo/keto reductase [Turicibacter sp. 1E2]
MEKFKLGMSDQMVSQIALGCMGLGGSWNKSEGMTKEDEITAVKAVEAALEQGINFFDHADIYKNGKSESAFSAIWEANLVDRESIYIQSKCGIRLADDLFMGSAPHYDLSYAYIMKSVDGILKRLKTDYLDTLLLHRPDALVEPEEVARAFRDLKEQQKVRYFGVSNHNAAQIALLQSYLSDPLVTNQLELSLVQSQLIDEGLNVNCAVNPGNYRNDGTFEYCRLNQLTIQAWSPLAGGQLATKEGREVYPTLVQTIERYAKEYEVSFEAIMIAWLLRHPAHIQPIVGTKTPSRIKAACEATRISLTKEQWYHLYNSGLGKHLL